MTLEILLAHPAVQALGHALLHFLWQGSLLALLLWAVKLATLQSAARLRYASATLIMLAMPVSLVVTMAWNSHEESQPATSIAGLAVQHPAAAAEPLVFPAPTLTEPRAGFPGWVVFMWLVGVLLLSVRALGGWMAAQRLKRGASSANGELEAIFRSVMLSLRISRPVRLSMSAMIRVPAALGWLEPCILLPVTALTGLSEAQIKAILAHELAHIRRNDYLVNLLQTAIETMLFYHPAVWWVGRQMRLEREHCCDDIAVTVCRSPLEYAQALADMEEIRDRIPEPALAATGGELLARIQRLLGGQNLGRQEHASRYLGAIIAAALVLITGSTVIVSLHAAPQDATSRFEVASIKPSPPGTPLGYTRFEPGGERSVAVGAPFRFMVREAWHLRNDQLIGVPDWMARERYDINARADGPHTAAELQAMVRNLFADRIKLQFRMETREGPIYGLVQDKGGAKLVRHDAVDPGDEDVATKNDPDPAKALYMNWTFVSAPMDYLAFMLSGALDRPVVNKTGLDGGYDFHIAFTMPWPANVPEGPVNGTTIDTSGPSVFDVIHNLGLRLEPQKGSVEVMKIDHVERPSPN